MATLFPRFEDYRFVPQNGRLLFLPLGGIGRRWMSAAYVVDPAVKDRFERRTARMTIAAITLPVAGAVVTAGQAVTLPRLVLVLAVAAVVALATFAIRIALELRDLRDVEQVPAPELDADTLKAMVRDRPPVADGVLAAAPTIWAAFLAGLWSDAAARTIPDDSARTVLTLVILALGTVSLVQLLKRMKHLRDAARAR